MFLLKVHLLDPLQDLPATVAHLASQPLRFRGWPLGPERNGKSQGGGGGGAEKEKIQREEKAHYLWLICTISCLTCPHQMKNVSKERAPKLHVPAKKSIVPAHVLTHWSPRAQPAPQIETPWILRRWQRLHSQLGTPVGKFESIEKKRVNNN